MDHVILTILVQGTQMGESNTSHQIGDLFGKFVAKCFFHSTWQPKHLQLGVLSSLVACTFSMYSGTSI